MLAEIGRELHVVLEFVLEEDEAVERLIGRAVEEGRTDDDPDVIRHRFVVWREQTLPLSAYYDSGGKLVSIDAAESVESVYETIDRQLRPGGGCA